MSKTYLPYDPDQQLLLPAALREWLPDDHLAYFISDVVDQLDLSSITARYEGERRGGPPYHPRMMVKVLLYGYCVGVASSRRIAQRLHEDIAFRVLAANNTPDFRTISDFRKDHLGALSGLFLQVLALCQRAGLVKLGHVALDGTKVRANASRHKAMSYKRMKEKEEQLAAEVAELLRRAQEVDEEEDRRYGQDKRGDELPEELAFREGRLEKIREAMAPLEAEAQAAAEQAEVEGKTHPGEPEDKAQRNFTDAESRIMPAPGGRDFLQAYNCQAVVDHAHQVIVAARATNQSSDKQQATALLLQTYDKVSDAEAKARADFDIRWKVALGIEIEDRPFAKSTLQLFRAQLILHDKVREVFESSLRLARQSGYLKKRGMRVALDTTCILGRGAVKDTYNLLADGIVKLLRALATVAKIAVGEWAEAQRYQKYLGSSIKGEAAIDWSDRKARAALLAELVADADRLLELARRGWLELPEDSAQRQSIVDGAELLGQLLLQDIERQSGDGDIDAHADDGVSLKDGVSKDRMLSVHDPELRHGHKSSRRRFDGHKAAIVVDTDSQLITAVDVLPGNAWDSMGAMGLVEQSEASAGVPVDEAMGDAAYGDDGARQDFSDAGRKLVARVPGRPNRKHSPKDDFVIDLGAGTCTCPAGQVTCQLAPMATRTDLTGRTYKLEGFRFNGVVCGACSLRPQCVAARPGIGRTVQRHPQEALSQEARALQQSPAFTEYRQLRVVVEHRLARLVQLGVRQARSFGRAKTKFQLYLAATVANLTLLTDKMGLTGDPDPELSDCTAVVRANVDCSANKRGNPAWALVCLTSVFLLISPFPKRTFRPNF